MLRDLAPRCSSVRRMDAHAEAAECTDGSERHAGGCTAQNERAAKPTNGMGMQMGGAQVPDFRALYALWVNRFCITCRTRALPGTPSVSIGVRRTGRRSHRR